MTIKNICVVCGNEFETSKYEKLCSDCLRNDRHVFGVIRDYLYDNIGANVTEVTNATGISTSLIMKYLKEGRIETVGKVMLLNCDSCGKAIRFGTLCDECKTAANRSFTSTAATRKTDKQTTMHTKTKKK